MRPFWAQRAPSASRFAASWATQPPPPILKNGGMSKATPDVIDALADVIERLRAAGYAVLICRSIDEVERGLAELGVMVRAKVR